jgi:uncharacterized protein YndB with AHSA1/START domain
MSDAKTAAAPTLVIRRTFNAPRERVFAAFTSPELLRRWWGPPGSELGEITFDARTGGRYRIAMKSSDGEDFNVGGVISEFDAPKRLTYTFRWEEDDPNMERDTRVSIDFLDRGNQTEIVLTQENFVSDESRSNHDRGWNGAFDKLSTIL